MKAWVQPGCNLLGAKSGGQVRVASLGAAGGDHLSNPPEAGLTRVASRRGTRNLTTPQIQAVSRSDTVSDGNASRTSWAPWLSRTGQHHQVSGWSTTEQNDSDLGAQVYMIESQ
jgi:hypothetical protein